MNSFFKRVVLLITGTVGAQVIMLIALPFLTRFYKPEQFGELAMLMALSILLSIVMGLRFDVALITPKHDRIAKKIFKLSIIISSVIFLSLYLISFLLLDLFNLIQESIFSAYILSLNNLLIGTLLRKNKVKKIAYSRFIQAFVCVVFQLFFAISLESKFGLVWGYILGLLVSTAFMVEKVNFYEKINNKDVWYIFSRFREFPLFNASQALVNTMANNVLVFAVKALFGSNFLGLYSIATRVVQTPMSIISQSMKQVLFKDFSDLFNRRSYVFNSLLKKTIISSLIPILPFYSFYLYSNQVVALVFGEGWEGVGDLASILLIWFYFIFISVPATAAIQVFSLQKKFLYYEFTLISVRFVFIFLAYITKMNPLTFILYFSLIGAFFNLLLIVYVHIHIKNKEVHNESRHLNLP